MARQRILSRQILEGFDKYTYNSVDTSVLSVYVMHPFWNLCVQFCPLWVAPNLLTFAGFLLTAANFALFSYYDYNFMATSQTSGEPIPSWVWLVSSLNLFVAYTLDGIDGKQARRTGTSGPLGELFDHGLDSYSTVLISTCLYSIFSRDELSPLRMHFVIWNIFINFYLTHWEKYNTGVMFLPWGYDFTMLGSIVVLLLTWWGSPEMWRVALPGGVTPGMMFEFILYSSAMLTSQTVILWNIYKSYRDRTGKMHTFPEAMRPLLPLVAFFVLSTVWAMLSPSDIISRHPRLFYLLTGTIFSNISCKLIVAQMSGTRCAASNSLLPPYLFCVLMSLAFSWMPLEVCAKIDTMLLYTICPLSTLAHISYGVDVVSDMCDHFNIRCFRINPKVKSSDK